MSEFRNRPLSGIIGLVWLILAAASAAQEGKEAVAPAPMSSYTIRLMDGKVTIEMLPVPVGSPGHPETFQMGSPEGEKGRKPDEGPRFQARVAAFWMSRCEITWDAYNEFRRDYGRLKERLEKSKSTASEWADAVSLPTPLWEQDSAPILQGLGTEGGYPVADISQFAARQFTKWLSRKTGEFYRLPTEVEWEYAARAGTASAWSFGDDPEALAEHAWFFDDSAYDDPDKGYPGSGMGYRKVGLKKPNAWGFHDLYGNVAEWVIDAYEPEGYAELARADSPAAMVRWPKAIFPCVARGGHWESEASETRSAARLASDPHWQYRDPQIPKSLWWYTDAFQIGFRIVRPAAPAGEAERLAFWDGDVQAIHKILELGGKQSRVKVPALPSESAK